MGNIQLLLKHRLSALLFQNTNFNVHRSIFELEYGANAQALLLNSILAVHKNTYQNTLWPNILHNAYLLQLYIVLRIKK